MNKRDRCLNAVKKAIPLIGLEDVVAYFHSHRNSSNQKNKNYASISKTLESEIKRIEDNMNQKPISRATLIIEWKKSQQWGLNPYLKAEIWYEDGSFNHSYKTKASGCGYDKESQVISNFLQDNMIYLLYNKKDELINKYPSGLTGISLGNRYPYFGGCCGYSSLRMALNLYLGYDMTKRDYTERVTIVEICKEK